MTEHEMRKRGPTFTHTEKSLLLEIIEKYLFIIENKKTDGVHIKAKNVAWDKVTTEFNFSSAQSVRSKANLQTCWSNLKKKVKSIALIQNKNKNSKDEVPEPCFDDPILSKVSSFLKEKPQGLDCKYDSDAVFSFLDVCIDKDDENTNTLENEDALDLEPKVEAPEFHALDNDEWFEHSPIVLRKSTSQELSDDLIENADEDNLDVNASVQNVEHSSTHEGSRQKYRTLHKIRHRRIGGIEVNAIAKAKLETIKISNRQAKEHHDIAKKILLMEHEHAKNVLLQDDEKLQQEYLKRRQEEENLLKVQLMRQQEEANLRKLNAIARQEETKAKILKLKLETTGK